MAGQTPMIFEFVSEAKEHLANVSDDLLALEKHRGEAARYCIDRLFRAVHSVKGGAGFFGCRNIETLAHLMETLLGRMREDHLQPGPGLVDALLSGTDRILALLDDVERSDHADISDIHGRLNAFFSEEHSAPQPVESRALVPAAPEEFDPASRLQERPAEHSFLYVLRIDLGERFRATGQLPLTVLQGLLEHGSILDARLETDGDLEGPLHYHALFSGALGPDELCRSAGLHPKEMSVLEAPLVPAAPAPAVAVVEEPASVVPRSGERAASVRISVNLLDRLMTLAGELVLVRNRAMRVVAPDDPLRPIVQRLDGVTSQMQDAVLLTRMQPVGNLFGKFPRMVRDLARQIGKEIELDIQGTEVELDKTILESLSDPLTHLIRNSCDHGIESPEQRARAGKPPAGRIRLSAHHEGGQIRIEVRDDGKGIDPAIIKRKAVESGLRAPAEVTRLSDKDALALILLPGFSTAATVTDVSGRGVGMDVVKTNLDQLGGSLDIESTVGEGTAFHLRLPLTLAIIPCLLVQMGQERYAIPQKDLEELVCVRPGQARGRIEYAYDREVYRLRDRLLPLVRLADVLAHPEPFTAATRKELLRQHSSDQENQLLSFAVVKVGARRFGLVVDRILNNEEIVVKPMHPELKSLTCYSGATILGDGRVALILDIAGIARHAGVFAALEPPQAAHANGQAEQDRQPVLLFQYGEREQFAVALAMIRRIELIRKERIETIGDKEYVTLDGVPTRVLRLDHYLNVSPGVDRDPLFLLLPRNLPRPLGLLASNLIDTEQLVIELNTDSHTEDGLLGTAIVRGRMTLFLDIFRLADKIDPARPEDRRPHSLPPVKRRVLLVDDTQFFREVVKGYLEAEGYEVETAVDGADGLTRLEAAEFDLVVSDIEMPVLDGWGFARAVRRRGSDVPLLALTTLSTDADRAKALACGFDLYEVKLDRERFLAAVAELMPETTTAVKRGG